MRSLINPWVLLGIILAVLGAGATGYWQGGKHMHDALDAAAAREEHIARVAYENAQRGTAEVLGKIKIKNNYITQPLQREVFHDPVFSNPDCYLSDTSFGLLNQKLLQGGATERAGADELPAGVHTAP